MNTERMSKREFERLKGVLALLFLLIPTIYSNAQINDLLNTLDDNSNRETTVSTNDLAKLKSPDVQTLRLIMVEIQDIGRLEQKQLFVDAANRIYPLRKAFEIMGTNLVPLLPALRAEFLSGKSIGASGWALVFMGENGWPVLRQGLTNTNERVQLCSLEAMPYIKGTNAWLALPSLTSLLTNNLDIVRMQAVAAVGKADVNSGEKIRLLLGVLDVETNYTVKCIAIKQLEPFVDDAKVVSILERLSKDRNVSVRYNASNALLHVEDKHAR